MSIHIHSLQEFKAFQESDTRVLVLDFFADWCGPCKAISPFFEKMAESELNKHVCFLKVDVDVANDLATELGVSAMPTFMAFKGDTKIAQITGANKDRLTEMIKQALA